MFKLLQYKQSEERGCALFLLKTRNGKPEVKTFLSVGSGKKNIILYIMMYTENIVTHRQMYQDTKL